MQVMHFMHANARSEAKAAVGHGTNTARQSRNQTSKPRRHKGR